jgi:hypothetical protein
LKQAGTPKEIQENPVDDSVRMFWARLSYFLYNIGCYAKSVIQSEVVALPVGRLFYNSPCLTQSWALVSKKYKHCNERGISVTENNITNIIVAIITAIGSIVGGFIGAYATEVAKQKKENQVSTDKSNKKSWGGVIAGVIAGAILTLIALAFLGTFPPHGKEDPINLSASDMPVFDDFESNSLDESKWLIGVDDSDSIKYSLNQKDGQLCIDVQNTTNTVQHFFLRSQISVAFSEIEADLTLASGDGYFGLDSWGSEVFNVYSLDSRGYLSTIYGYNQGNAEEKVLQNIESSLHRLKLVYSTEQVEYYLDGMKVKTRPAQGTMNSYGLKVSPFAHSKVKACVSEYRVQFK